VGAIHVEEEADRSQNQQQALALRLREFLDEVRRAAAQAI